MAVVGTWTGQQASILQAALRMTNESFADHLGVALRTVSKWREQPGLVQTANFQAMLDTALEQADESSQARFLSLLEMSHVAIALPSSNRSVRFYDPQSLTERAIVMATAEESSDHGRTAGSSNVGDAELAWLEGSLDRVAVDLMTGPLIPLVLEMRQIRDQAFTALEGRQYPRQSRRLYAVGARACGLLAVVTSDRFGIYEAAARHARTASVAANLAEEPAVHAWASSLESTIAFWQGRYRSAAIIAQEARMNGPDGVEAARLAAFEARAWAKDGDRESMISALEAAKRAREADGPSAGIGAMAYPLSDQVRMAGTAHLWIGDTEKAEGELTAALGLLVDEYDSLPHVAVTRADLALAYLRSDSLDDAADALSPLLSMTDSYLAGAARRATDLTGALQSPRYATSQTARQLVSDIEAFVAAQKLNGDVAQAGARTDRALPQ
ncbi:hypothetical protein GCM10009744_36540 [Kribbella alba]|uniref:XRE family transcriptional regulator n=1 Tax=Kribbella alba TaxID=190197 RepID=A0ABP4RGN7_9ACTN